MRKFTIQVMNYRCFSGNKPIAWSFNGDALTSFVGPNNAGKSTFLRLFYELRHIFATFTDPTQIRNFATNNHLGLGFLGVGDSAEIPSFQSIGPVVLDFAISVVRESDLSRMRLSMNRTTSAWTVRLWVGRVPNELKLEV